MALLFRAWMLQGSSETISFWRFSPLPHTRIRRRPFTRARETCQRQWGNPPHHLLRISQTRGTRENRAPPCAKVPGSSRVPWWLGLHQSPWSFGFDSQTRGTRENGAPPCIKVPGSSRVPAPPWVGSRSPDGWDQIPRWAGGWACTSHPGVLGSIPKREEPVRDGQTSPHRPRLVVSRSTCPPISPPSHANSFVLGPAVINTHNPKP